MFSWIKQKLYRAVVAFLEQPSCLPYHAWAVSDPGILQKTLQPCDVLLIEGDLRYSSFIKYTTHSSWTHCALYLGDYSPNPDTQLVEVLLSKGVILSSLKSYYGFNTRILRPIGLTELHKKQVMDYCLNKLGHHYDLVNVINLLKYHLPMIRYLVGKVPNPQDLASGHPEQVICSSLLAQAFSHIHYPIALNTEQVKDLSKFREKTTNYERITTINQHATKRHFSLFLPRDFDLSPFFKVIKPTIESGFYFS